MFAYAAGKQFIVICPSSANRAIGHMKSFVPCLRNDKIWTCHWKVFTLSKESKQLCFLVWFANYLSFRQFIRNKCSFYILDLTLEGVPCSRKQSGKEKRRLELQKRNSESSVPKFPPITNSGLVEQPKTRGGLAFDITFCPETGNMKKAQLPKLERRKKRKKLTKEELEEKMRKAAERRQVENLISLFKMSQLQKSFVVLSFCEFLSFILELFISFRKLQKSVCS